MQVVIATKKPSQKLTARNASDETRNQSGFRSILEAAKAYTRRFLDWAINLVELRDLQPDVFAG